MRIERKINVVKFVVLSALLVGGADALYADGPSPMTPNIVTTKTYLFGQAPGDLIVNDAVAKENFWQGVCTQWRNYFKATLGYAQLISAECPPSSYHGCPRFMHEEVFTSYDEDASPGGPSYCGEMDLTLALQAPVIRQSISITFDDDSEKSSFALFSSAIEQAVTNWRSDRFVLLRWDSPKVHHQEKVDDKRYLYADGEVWLTQ